MSRVVEIGEGASAAAQRVQSEVHEQASPGTRSKPNLTLSRTERRRAWRDGALCALAVAVAWLVAWPFANMALGDDFSYAKTALEFARTGHFVYNGWATAMLGWQIPWGALFIKLFGFSFNILRISMLPIAMATVFLFQQVLRRFGISPGNAILGALTLGLSPLFLPLAASFMTDIPGLFVIVVCIYMCQRAVAAKTDRAALFWLLAATLINVAGGTVRQIAWLGSLIMVPTTAWLMRERRGMKTVGIVLFLASFLGVLGCLHWFKAQPYSVPYDMIGGPIHTKMIAHLAAQLLKSFFCLLLLVFPVPAAWLASVRGSDRRAKLFFACSLSLLISICVVLYLRKDINGWLMPWLVAVLGMQWNMIPQMFTAKPSSVIFLIRLLISILVLAPALAFASWISGTSRREEIGPWSLYWKNIAWILIPFSLVYVLLLTPGGTYSAIHDRYVMGLTPIAIVFFLILQAHFLHCRVSKVSVGALALVAMISIAGTHDLYSEARAVASTLQTVRESGVPRKAIQATLTSIGWADDGWVQVENGGHINDSRIRVPAGAYNPHTPDPNLPIECTAPSANLMPAIVARYFLVTDPRPCFAQTNFSPVHYSTWLPPFHRAVYVQKLKNDSPYE